MTSGGVHWRRWRAVIMAVAVSSALSGRIYWQYAGRSIAARARDGPIIWSLPTYARACEVMKAAQTLYWVHYGVADEKHLQTCDYQKSILVVCTLEHTLRQHIFVDRYNKRKQHSFCCITAPSRAPNVLHGCTCTHPVISTRTMHFCQNTRRL